MGGFQMPVPGTTSMPPAPTWNLETVCSSNWTLKPVAGSPTGAPMLLSQRMRPKSMGGRRRTASSVRMCEMDMASASRMIGQVICPSAAGRLHLARTEAGRIGRKHVEVPL